MTRSIESKLARVLRAMVENDSLLPFFKELDNDDAAAALHTLPAHGFSDVLNALIAAADLGAFARGDDAPSAELADALTVDPALELDDVARYFTDQAPRTSTPT